MNVKEMAVGYFGLDEDSKSRFIEAYDNPFIDDIYKPYIGSDYRFRTSLPESLYESFDRGWETLKLVLPELVSQYEIAYDDFYNNKKMYKKNNFKVIKLIRSYFSENLTYNKIHRFLVNMRQYESNKFYEYQSYCEDNGYSMLDEKTIIKAVNLFIDRINELRFSKTKKIEVVLSLNRDDWFLSTTNESWRTCLSLESPSFASYWVSLAGAVVDKNIALLYITNGDKKEYLGNTIDKVLSRTWVLLDRESVLNAVKFYPSSLLSINNLQELFPLEIKKISVDFKSKYSITPLKFKNGFTNYIYQDKTRPCNYKDGTFELEGGGKGLYTFYKDKMFEGPIFSYHDGFKNLVNLALRTKTNTDIINFFKSPVQCAYCGSYVSFSREYKVDYNEDVCCIECYENGKMKTNDTYEDDFIEDEYDDNFEQVVKIPFGNFIKFGTI